MIVAWGTDQVRVVVAGELPREAHNAPLHLFSAAPELVLFGGGAYRRHSKETSLLLEQVFEGLRKEGLSMPYTMEDFKRDLVRKEFAKLTPEEQADMFRSLPPEKQKDLFRSLLPDKRLAELSAEELCQPQKGLPTTRSGTSRKPRRKK